MRAGASGGESSGSSEGGTGGDSTSGGNSAAGDDGEGTGGLAGAGDGGQAGNAIGGKGGGGASGSAGIGGAPGAGGSSGGGPAAAFYESFEDGTLEPWASGPEGAASSIVDDFAADGSSRSLSVPGDVYYYAGPNISFDPIAATYVSWWIRFSGALPDNNGVAHFSLSSDPDALEKLLQIWAAREGFIMVGGRGSNVIVGGGPPAEDTWYHLELIIDWTTRAVALSLDGTAILEDELAGPGTGIRRIDLYSVELATCYFDEIRLVL
jgi:hypothetical protein